jgi:endo-1,4-beta-xylanase
VYYLHGSGGMPRDGADSAQRLDKAIRAGRAAPMITVFVNGLRGGTMYCDSRDGKYPLETVIVKDLIPHVDATYRTVVSREGRGVDGFSMGGFGAAHLGFKYPDLFGVVSIRAPALLGPELKQATPSHAWAKLFPAAMGSDLEYFRANDPFTLAAKNAEVLRERSIIRIVCHVEPDNWLAPRCEELHQLLMREMIPHEFHFLANVKSHDRVKVMDTMGDAAYAFYSTAFDRLQQAPAAPTPTAPPAPPRAAAAAGER